MKLQNLIEALQKRAEELGPQAEMALMTDTPDGLFHFDFEPVVDVIQIPDEYRGTLSAPTVAIGWAHCFDRGEE